MNTSHQDMSLISSIITTTLTGGAPDTKQDDSEEQLLKIVAKVAKKELRESKETRAAAVSQLAAWVRSNGDIENVRTDDDFLLRFLRVKKFNVQLAQQMLLKYLNLRRTFPHLTAYLDCQSDSMKDLMTQGYLFPSPCRDKHGRRVLISSTRKKIKFSKSSKLKVQQRWN